MVPLVVCSLRLISMYTQLNTMGHGEVRESPHIGLSRNQKAVNQQDCEGLNCVERDMGETVLREV